jgi:hypothetical protein
MLCLQIESIQVVATIQINNTKKVGCSLQGTLAHAKNGDEVFWKEKFHAANGKAQACIQGALLFFPFMFWGGGERDFFSIFLASQCVRTMFLSSSQCVPNIFSIPLHFYPICLGKWCPPFTYIHGPKGRTVQNRAFCFGGVSIVSFFE